MSVALWIQSGSLTVLTLALVANFWQIRVALGNSQRTAEDARRAAYINMISAQTDTRTAFMLDDPELLDWHLRARGYPSTTPLENKRRLYILVRLESHESNFMASQQKLLDSDTWRTWDRLLRADTRMPEFREIWPRARVLYLKPFAEHVDEHIVNDGPLGTAS